MRALSCLIYSYTFSGARKAEYLYYYYTLCISPNLHTRHALYCYCNSGPFSCSCRSWLIPGQYKNGVLPNYVIMESVGSRLVKKFLSEIWGHRALDFLARCSMSKTGSMGPLWGPIRPTNSDMPYLFFIETSG